MFVSFNKAFKEKYEPPKELAELVRTCSNCEYLWEMEDWKGYPKGDFIRLVCGALAYEQRVMALFGNLHTSMCEMYEEKKNEA